MRWKTDFLLSVYINEYNKIKLDSQFNRIEDVVLIEH